MAYNIRLRNDTRQNWIEQNPILSQGEVAIEFQSEDDNNVKIKIGDGTTAYESLPYFNGEISYTDLIDKPSLNGITIDGDKTLSDYGIQPIGNYVTNDTVTSLLSVKANADDTYTKSEIDALFDALTKIPSVGSLYDRYLKIDKEGNLVWAYLADEVYTIEEMDELLANKVTAREGYSLVADEDVAKIESFEVYDDTEIKEDIEELWTEIERKAYTDDLSNYVSTETLNNTLENYATTTDLVSKANASELYNHISDTSNPHNVTAEQLGLGNVDNTSDLDKPISTAVQEALDNKQDSLEIGFGLSLEDGVLINTNPNVNADWEATDGDSYINNKPNLSTVALSNDYNDLDNLPYIPSDYELPIASEETLGGIKIGSDFTITEDGILQANNDGTLYDYMELSNKPSIIVLDENNIERTYEFIPGMTKADLDIAGYDETQSALNLKADAENVYTKLEVDAMFNNISISGTSNCFPCPDYVNVKSLTASLSEQTIEENGYIQFNISESGEIGYINGINVCESSNNMIFPVKQGDTYYCSSENMTLKFYPMRY